MVNPRDPKRDDQYVWVDHLDGQDQDYARRAMIGVRLEKGR